VYVTWVGQLGLPIKEATKDLLHLYGVEVLQLLHKIISPKIDQSIMKAVMDCRRCKESRYTHLNSLLKPITRCHPFEFMVADTLSVKRKWWYHEACPMDSHVCTAGVIDKVEVSRYLQDIAEGLSATSSWLLRKYWW
jgi:hypothetical protein